MNLMSIQKEASREKKMKIWEDLMDLTLNRKMDNLD